MIDGKLFDVANVTAMEPTLHPYTVPTSRKIDFQEFARKLTLHPYTVPTSRKIDFQEFARKLTLHPYTVPTPATPVANVTAMEFTPNSTRNVAGTVFDEESHDLMLEKSKHKVAIVGFASSWKEVPWDDESFEVWGLNELYKLAKHLPNARFDRWFEIHNPQSPSKNNPEHIQWLKKCPIPLYMQKKYEEFPNSIPYPKEEIKEYFNKNMVYSGNTNLPSEINDFEKAVRAKGSKFTNYSNQISWMTALAIYEGFKEIHIYGVDMATKEEIISPGGDKIDIVGEYIWQRPSVEFFVGFALGKGIKFLIPATSELCKFPQEYGFETDNQIRIFLRNRKKEHINRLNQLAIERNNLINKMKQIDIKIGHLQGAIGEVGYLLGNHIV